MERHDICLKMLRLPENGRKLIKEASLDVETKAFDTFISDLEKEVESLGGYIEYSSVGGSSYLAESSQRTAWYTARIPEEKLETFISKIGDNGNITNISQNVRDITLEYVDVAGGFQHWKPNSNG